MITRIDPIEPLGDILLRDVLHLVREYTATKMDDRMLRLCSNIAISNLYNSNPDIANHYGSSMSGTADKVSGNERIIFLHSPVKNTNSLYGAVTKLNELSGMRKYVSFFYRNKNTIESSTRVGYNKFGEEILSSDPAYTAGIYDDILIPSHIIALITGIVCAGKELHMVPWAEYLYRRNRPIAPLVTAKGFWSKLGDSLFTIKLSTEEVGAFEIYFTRNVILDNLLDIDTVLSGYNANIDVPQSLFGKYFELFIQLVAAANNKMIPTTNAQESNNGTAGNTRAV